MSPSKARTLAQNLGLVLGLALLVLAVFTEPPGGLTVAAWRTAGVSALMAVWWATEALPIPATALMPIGVLPLLGVADVDTVAAGYGNSTIYLILGGFLVALAMERWDLHKRIAYNVVVHAGGSPRLLVLGMMSATAFVSMWASNTSTALMMIPVALSVAHIVAPDLEQASSDQRNFAAAIVCCVAFGATIGGLGTIVGTPTNALAVGFMRENYGIGISFAEWLIFGVPTVLILLPLAWLALMQALPFKLGTQAAAGRAVQQALADLGPVSAAERRVAWVFVATALSWVFRPLLVELPGLGRLNDTAIAIAAGLVLFLVPAGTSDGGALLRGPDLRRVPWDVLLLFGGGLALAAIIQDSGLSQQIGQLLGGLAGLPLVALVFLVCLLLVFWTELNSNVAAAATFMPILGAIAGGTDYPVIALVAPAAMAASCGFMLPVGTPPNAIVYGTGQISMRQMMRAGFWVDVVSVFVITGVIMLVLPWLT
mgnify:CR=1 FL=1